MAQDHTETHCGVGGVGIEPPSGDRMTDMADGPGDDLREPTEANREPEPERGLGVVSVKSATDPAGVDASFLGRIVHDPETGASDLIMQGAAAPIRFTDDATLRRFMQDHGLAEGGTAYERADSDYISGYSNALSWQQASPAMRNVAVMLTRLFGNNSAAAQALRAYRDMNANSEIDLLASQFERWKELPFAEQRELIASLPDAAYDQTVAGRVLNARMRAEAYWTNANAVIAAAAKRYGTGADENMAYLEQLEMAARNSGIRNTASPIGSMFLQFQQHLKSAKAAKLGITEHMVSDFLLMKHHPERKAMVEANYQEMKANGASPADLARYERDNPTGFEWQGKRGEEAMWEFDQSLSTEQREHLEGLASFLYKAVAATNDRLLDANIIDLDTHAQRVHGQPYWVPLTDFSKSRSNQRFIDAPVGRRTRPDSPMASAFEWMDSAHRAAATNLYHQELLRMVRKHGMDDVFQVNAAGVDHKNAWGGDRRMFTRDDKGIFVFNPRSDGKIGTDHISFTNTANGRILRNALLPKHSGEFKGMQTADGLSVARGYMRFISLSYTLAKPTWFPRMLAMNFGMAPMALQSAYGLTTQEAFRGMGMYIPNMARMLGASFRDLKSHGREGAHVDTDWLQFFRENHGGTVTDERFRGPKLQRTFLTDIMSPRELVSEVGVAGAGKALAARGFEKFLHFQHSPDLMTQAAAFRTFLELKTGRMFSNIEEMRQFAATREGMDLVTQASNGSRRVLPNFAQAGGGGGTGWLREFYPFFNASIQTFPYARHVFATSTGRMGAAAMIIAGYAMREMYAEETGDTQSSLNGEDGAFYYGNQFSVPADYLLQPLLKAGANLYHVQNGSMSAKDAAIGLKDGVMFSALKAFSPVEAPHDEKSTPISVLMNVTPPITHAPILFLTGMDQYGNSVVPENVTGPDGTAMVGARNWQYGRPSTDLLSTQTARGLAAITGGMVDIAPGRLSVAMRSLLPILPDTVDAFTGEKAAAKGRDDTFAQRVTDFLAPAFEGQQSDVYGGRSVFDEAVAAKVRGALPAGQGSTVKDLLAGGDAGAARALAVQSAVRSRVEGLTVNGMNRAQINTAIVSATQAGDISMRNALLLMQKELRVNADAIYREAADQLGD